MCNKVVVLVEMRGRLVRLRRTQDRRRYVDVCIRRRVSPVNWFLYEQPDSTTLTHYILQEPLYHLPK
jgi:hypothetical protein